MWIDDQIIENCHKTLHLECFFPKENLVVCGRSQKPEQEVYLDRCKSDKVPVVKRFGGGGTVLLGQGTLVVSLGTWVKDYYENPFYFDGINQQIIKTLESQYPDTSGKLSQNGISDIVWGQKKVAGTSLYRSRNYLLFQGSILIDANIEEISKYLKHPSKEPEYRGERHHKDFLMNLKGTEDQDFDVNEFSKTLTQNLKSNFKDKFTEPSPKQVKYLKGKVV